MEYLIFIIAMVVTSCSPEKNSEETIVEIIKNNEASRKLDTSTYCFDGC